MKITLSKSQWEKIGKVAGWTKIAQNQTLNIQAVENDLRSLGFRRTGILEPSKIQQNIWNTGRGEVVILTSDNGANPQINGIPALEWFDQVFEKSLGSMAEEPANANTNKTAQSIPQRPQVEEDPEDMRYCSECGAQDPEFKIMDVGIGSYEFWGSRGRDVRLTTGTACCGGGVVDGLGNEVAMPEVDEVRGEPNYGEGRN